MRLLFFILLFSTAAQAQPGGYTEGQLECWPYNSRDHLYKRAVGWDPEFDHILIFGGGAGQTTCTGSTYPNMGNMDDMAPGTILNDGNGNWNGITNGGGVKWLVLIIKNDGQQPANYAADIAYFFENATMGFDTSAHERIHIGGGSQGVGNLIGWLQNTSVASGNPYRKIFSTAMWMSSTFITITADYPVPYNYCWYGTGETDPPESYNFAGATLDLFNNLPGTAGEEKFYKTTSGTGHNNSTWGDFYNVSGTDSSTNRWIWMVQQPGYVAPEPENKITGIQFADMIDHQGGSGDPFAFFDEQSTADPENDITPACATRNFPNAYIYYPSYHGNQWRFTVDLRAQYHVKKIWYYVGFNNDAFDDTLFIFKTSNLRDYIKVDSIRIATPTATGWYSLLLDDTTRYLTFGLKREIGAGTSGEQSPYIMEIIPYGDLLAGETRLPGMPTSFQGTKRPKKTLGELVGINIIGGYEPMHNFSDFAHVRVMNGYDYINDSTNVNGLVDFKLNGDHFGEYAGGTGLTWRAMEFLWDSLEHTTGFLLPEFNGAPMKIIEQAGAQVCWQFNNLGDNPLLLSSYTEAGYTAWNVAAKYGAVPIDSNRLRIFRTPRVTGMGLNMHITFGSEIERFWGGADTALTSCRYTGSLLYATEGQMLYDGLENSFGDSIGIVNADPNMKLGAAATYKIDSITWNSRFKLGKGMRSDGQNIFSSIQFNEYPEKNYDGIGVRSVHAVNFGLSTAIEKSVDFIYRMDSTMESMLTENGMDANANSAPKGTPPRTGSTWTDREWQAINLGWNIIEVSKTHLDRYYIYVLVTNSAEDAGTFQTSDIMTSWPTINYKPPYYYVRNMIRTLRNYRHEATIQSSWRGLCIEKYRNVDFPDSVAYVPGIADTTGLTLTGQVIPMAGVIGTPKKVELSFTSFTNTESDVTVIDGEATLDVGEKPFVILALEGEAENVSPSAAAGTDQSITLPSAVVTVDGSSSSDPDGTIFSYAWTKISGPATYTITSPSSASTTITGLVAGTYVFRLTVTDNDSATDTDDITITVNAAPVPSNRRSWFRGSLRNKFRRS